MTDQEEVSREDYNWEHAVRDLALTTYLTTRDAFDMTYPLRGEIHPYDAMPLLAKFVISLGQVPQRNYMSLGQYLFELLKLRKES